VGLTFSRRLALISSCIDWREAISAKEFSSSRFNFFVLVENLAKQLILVAQSILKLDNLGRRTLEG
jgi:hypothetical protein